MSDAHLPPPRPAHVFDTWHGWLFLGVALVLAAGTAVLINLLWERADESRRVQRDLVLLSYDAEEFNSLELGVWFRETLSEASAARMKSLQTQMHERASRFSLLASREPQMKEFSDRYRAYVLLIDHELTLDEAAEFKAVGNFKVGTVDPAYDALESTMEAVRETYDKIAVRTEAGMFLVLVGSVGVIALLVWQFNIKRRLVAVGAAEQRALSEVNLLLQTEVAERIRAEEALRKASSYNRRLIEANLDPLVTIGPDGTITDVNTATEAVTGVSRDRLIGDDFANYFTEPEKATAGYQKVLAEGAVKDYPLTIKHASSTITDVLYNATVYKDETGKIQGVFAAAHDITERKKTQQASQRSERDLKEAQRVGRIGSWDWDIATDTITWSDEYYRVYGLDPETSPPAYVEHLKLYTPESAARLDAAVTHTQQTGEEYQLDLERAHAGGARRWVSAHGEVKRDAQGQIVGLRGTAQDITARKRLEAQRARLAALVEASHDFIGFADANTAQVQYINKHGRRMCGIGEDEDVRTLKFSDVHPAWMNTRLTEAILPAAVRDGSWEGEAAFLHRDGREIPVLMVLQALKDANGEVDIFYTVSHEITKRKRIEAELLQSQKLETVGKLASGVAHEFNSLMTTIIGQSELLLNDLSAGNPLSRHATEIRTAAEEAAILTRQLLAYGRKQILRPDILDLNAVLAGMESAVRHLMSRDVDVRMAPAAGLQAVRMDPGQLEQVILNIVMNAADAMPNGGALTIATANVTLEQEDVSGVSELQAGDYVRLAITDTGTGMSADVKARVFEPFFTTKGVGGGNGLGLSTCYGIVKQSGGHLSVESEPGRGATFTVYLPQVEPQTPAAPSVPRLDAPDLPRGTETILLVEDDPALREMAATLLRRLGYTVWAAASGIDALSLSPLRGAGPIDVLITDVALSQMSGHALSERLRASSPHARTLFTPASTTNLVVPQGGSSRGVASLQKPFTPSALAHKLREVLDQPIDPTPEAERQS